MNTLIDRGWEKKKAVGLLLLIIKQLIGELLLHIYVIAIVINNNHNTNTT